MPFDKIHGFAGAEFIVGIKFRYLQIQPTKISYLSSLWVSFYVRPYHDILDPSSPVNSIRLSEVQYLLRKKESLYEQSLFAYVQVF